jgi:hypothetical protein
MDNNKEIFLPDTTVKLGVLKEKLSDVYGLKVISRNTNYLYIGTIIIFGSIILYNSLKK